MKTTPPTLFVLCILFCYSCNPSPSSEKDQEEELTTETEVEISPPPPSYQQIILASSPSLEQSTGWLVGYEWTGKSWAISFDSVACSFGKNGVAPLHEKLEGDGKTPSGTYPIGAAFGYDPFPESSMPYIELQDDHYWISDVASSAYNQLVEYAPKDKYSEKMRRKDHLYKYGIIIEYNTEEVVPGKGSAIFIHVQRRPGAPTAGCIAMSEDRMRALIQ